MQQSEEIVTIAPPTIINPDIPRQDSAEAQNSAQQLQPTLVTLPDTQLVTAPIMEGEERGRNNDNDIDGDDDDDDDDDESNVTMSRIAAAGTASSSTPIEDEPALRLPYISVASPSASEEERHKAALTAAAAVKAVMTVVKQHKPSPPPPPFAKVYLWSRKNQRFERSIILRPHRTEFYIGTSVSECTMIVNVNGIDLKHGRIEYNPLTGHFTLFCLSKNAAGFKVLRFAEDGTALGEFATVTSEGCADIAYGTAFSVLTKAFFFADPAAKDAPKVDPAQIAAMLEAGKEGIPPPPPPAAASAQQSQQQQQAQQGQQYSAYLQQRVPPPPRSLSITMDEPLATLPPPPPLAVSDVMFPGAFSGAAPLSAEGLYPSFHDVKNFATLLGEKESDNKKDDDGEKKEEKDKDKKDDDEEKKEGSKNENEKENEEEEKEKENEKENDNENEEKDKEKEKEKEKDVIMSNDEGNSPQPPEIDELEIIDDDVIEEENENENEKEEVTKEVTKSGGKKGVKKSTTKRVTSTRKTNIKENVEEEEEEEERKDKVKEDDMEIKEEEEVKENEVVEETKTNDNSLKRKNAGMKSLDGVVNVRAPEGKKLRYSRRDFQMVVNSALEVIKKYRIQKAGFFSVTARITHEFKAWTFDGVIDPETGKVCEDLEPIFEKE